MAKYLVDILGDQLLTEPLSNYPVNNFILFIFRFFKTFYEKLIKKLKPGVLLPSPEDHKYKIMIKFRRKRLESKCFKS